MATCAARRRGQRGRRGALDGSRGGGSRRRRSRPCGRCRPGRRCRCGPVPTRRRGGGSARPAGAPRRGSRRSCAHRYRWPGVERRPAPIGRRGTRGWRRPRAYAAAGQRPSSVRCRNPAATSPSAVDHAPSSLASPDPWPPRTSQHFEGGPPLRPHARPRTSAGHVGDPKANSSDTDFDAREGQRRTRRPSGAERPRGQPPRWCSGSGDPATHARALGRQRGLPSPRRCGRRPSHSTSRLTNARGSSPRRRRRRCRGSTRCMPRRKLPDAQHAAASPSTTSSTAKPGKPPDALAPVVRSTCSSPRPPLNTPAAGSPRATPRALAAGQPCGARVQPTAARRWPRAGRRAPERCRADARPRAPRWLIGRGRPGDAQLSLSYSYLCVLGGARNPSGTRRRTLTRQRQLPDHAEDLLSVRGPGRAPAVRARAPDSAPCSGQRSDLRSTRDPHRATVITGISCGDVRVITGLTRPSDPSLFVKGFSGRSRRAEVTRRRGGRWA